MRVKINDPLSMRPQLDDIESEITYLLLREYKPEHVVEISPSAGWSTSWILRALQYNQLGHLYSFDFIDDSTSTIPEELYAYRWTFIQGDIKRNIDKLSQQIDYLFIVGVSLRL